MMMVVVVIVFICVIVVVILVVVILIHLLLIYLSLLSVSLLQLSSLSSSLSFTDVFVLYLLELSFSSLSFYHHPCPACSVHPCPPPVLSSVVASVFYFSYYSVSLSFVSPSVECFSVRGSSWSVTIHSYRHLRPFFFSLWSRSVSTSVSLGGCHVPH